MLSRSVCGVVPEVLPLERPRRVQDQLIYETTIPTIENPPQTATRILEPQFVQERASDFAQSAPGRAQAPNARIIERMAVNAPQRLGLPRTARIKAARDFARVRRDGGRLALGCLIANWRRLPSDSCSRLGVITSSRIGGAVDRNRARRLLRESFRMHQHQLAHPLDLVLVARRSIVGKGFTEVESDFLTSLGKAGLLK
jgi:ribonuclease P protein component